MKNNQLHWEQIRPDFKDSNSAIRNANDMQSKVGNAITESMKGLQGISDILGKEKANIEQNREQYFNEMGKKISEQANLEGMEVVTFDDGTSGHRFNYEKAMLAKQRKMQEEYDNYAIGTGEEMSESDFARLWNAGNMDNYMKEGIKNSQDNALNKIKRDELKETIRHNQAKEQIERETAWLNAMKQSGKSDKDIANSIDTNKYMTEGISNLIEDDFNIKNYDDFINRVNQVLPYMNTRPQDQQYLSFFTNKEKVQNTIEYFKNKPDLSKKDKVNYLAKQLGMNKEDVEKSPVFNEMFKEIDRVEGIEKYKQSLNDGTSYTKAMTRLAKEKGAKYDDTNDKDKLGMQKMINFVGNLYQRLYPKATANELDEMLYNYLNSKTRVDDGEFKWTKDFSWLFSGKRNFNSFISDLQAGINNDDVMRMLGITDEKTFEIAKELANELYPIGN